MKVRELMERLAQEDPDTVVYVSAQDAGVLDVVALSGVACRDVRLERIPDGPHEFAPDAEVLEILLARRQPDHRSDLRPAVLLKGDGGQRRT